LVGKVVEAELRLAKDGIEFLLEAAVDVDVDVVVDVDVDVDVVVAMHSMSMLTLKLTMSLQCTFLRQALDSSTSVIPKTTTSATPSSFQTSIVFRFVELSRRSS
jgi:hypothetical protein